MLKFLADLIFGKKVEYKPTPKAKILPMEESAFKHMQTDSPTNVVAPVVKKATEAAKKPRTTPRKPVQRVDKTSAVIPTQLKHSSPRASVPIVKKEEKKTPSEGLGDASDILLLTETILSFDTDRSDTTPAFSGGGGDFGGGGADSSWSDSSSSSDSSSNDAGNY